MAKKKASKKKKPAAKKAAKKPEKKIPEKPGMVKVTPTLKRSWFGARNVWTKSMYAFGTYLSRLSKKDAKELLEFSKAALFKNTYKEIVVEHPELKKLILSDLDRGCMIDIFTNLSVRFRDYSASEKLSRLERFKYGRLGYNV